MSYSPDCAKTPGILSYPSPCVTEAVLSWGEQCLLYQVSLDFLPGRDCPGFVEIVTTYSLSRKFLCACGV